MKDWKGNEIKIGDTISSYYYKCLFGGSEIVRFDPENGFKQERVGKTPEFCWVLSSRFIVTPPSNSLTIAETDESIGEIPINMADSDWVLPQKHLMCLCIEGVSDNEQDFFEEYFKVKR